jgi:hypothetical protein
MVKKRPEVPGAPYAFRTTADGKVFISWQGRPVMTLKGDRAASFLKKIAGLDERRQQLIMARITGNFKRGSER